MQNLFFFYSRTTCENCLRCEAQPQKNEKKANGTFFFQILAFFLGVGYDYHYIDSVLRANGSSDFDDSVTNREQIQASFKFKFDPEQLPPKA